MDDQPWLARVREQLARHDLPPSYVQRFIEELGDHLEDLEEEGTEADASSRLGEPQQVADAAVVAYRRRSFLGRHPLAAFLVFAVSPVIPQYALVVACVVVFMQATSSRVFDWYEQHWTFSLMIVACSTFVGALYGEAAMRLGIGRKWMLASCAVLGAVGMLHESGLPAPIGLHVVMVLAQFAVPLAVAWWFTKWKCRHRSPVTAFLVFALSPVASLMLLWLLAALAITTTQPLWEKFGSVDCGPIATVSRFALIAPFSLFVLVFPPLMASLLYCKFAQRFESGKAWMFVSCAVIAAFHVMWHRVPIDHSDGVRIVLTTGIMLAQLLAPLAVGYWFLRRMNARNALGLAS